MKKIFLLFCITLVLSHASCYYNENELQRCANALNGLLSGSDETVKSSNFDVKEFYIKSRVIFIGTNGNATGMDCVPQRLEFKGFTVHDLTMEARLFADLQVTKKSENKDQAFGEFYNKLIKLYNELLKIDKKLSKNEHSVSELLLDKRALKKFNDLKKKLE